MRLAHKKRWLLAAGLLAAALLLWTPARRAVWAARLAFSLNGLAQAMKAATEEAASQPHAARTAFFMERLERWDRGRRVAVTGAKAVRAEGGRTYEALYYRPSKTAAQTAVVIAAGLSERGCYDPRLVALARTLASGGLLVLTPDIREFREFEISAEPVGQIAFWHRQVRSLEGGGRVRKIGVAGISYSGTMAVIAASRPEIRDDTAFVLAVGPYFDLLRCSREWFAAGSPGEWKGFYPQRYYARWLLMRAALDMLPDPGQRRFLDETLAALIATHRAPAVPPGTPPEARRWRALAAARPGESDAELAAAIERHLAAALYEDLDPEKSLDGLRCPLFLIHGAHDDLIPPRESAEMHRRAEGLGKTSHLFVSSALGHTQPVGGPRTFRRQLADAWDAFVFGYRLAAAMSGR